MPRLWRAWLLKFFCRTQESKPIFPILTHALRDFNSLSQIKVQLVLADLGGIFKKTTCLTSYCGLGYSRSIRDRFLAIGLDQAMGR
jgi:hypothetical protein